MTRIETVRVTKGKLKGRILEQWLTYRRSGEPCDCKRVVGPGARHAYRCSAVEVESVELVTADGELVDASGCEWVLVRGAS